MSHYECPQSSHAGECRWPVKDRNRALRAALSVIQANLGRYVTDSELKTLASSEPWHCFLWHCVRGMPVALRWNDILVVPKDAEPGEHAYADTAEGIEEMLMEAFREREVVETPPEVAVLTEAREREPRPRRFV